VKAPPERPLRPPPRRRGIFTAALFAFVGVVILCGLGTWQIERRAWKEALMDTLQRRLAAAPVALPERARWPQLDAAQDEFRRVSLHAALVPGQQALVYTAGSAFRPDVSGPGYWVFAPAKLADDTVVVVNRGFVPEGWQDRVRDAAAPPPQDIVGVMRWPEAASWLTPAAEPAKNLWFARDHLAMAAAKGWGGFGQVAPFFVDQEAPVASDGVPRPGPLVVQLRNEHLQYAVTWFGLALVLAVVFGVWAWGRRST
jgi:cytochrome oxidase assembly protein ShyY1